MSGSDTEQGKVERSSEEDDPRSWAAWTLSVLYGLCQGWGYSGLALSQVEAGDIDPIATHFIALLVALPVAIRSAWLVQPEFEDYIVFEKYKQIFNRKQNNAMSKTTVIWCVLSSLLLAAVTSYGITHSLRNEDAFIHTENTEALGAMMVMMTIILTLAESLLDMQSFDDAWKEGYSKQEQELYTQFKTEETKLFFGYGDISKANKAKIIYNGTFMISILGMLGIALVGTVPLSSFFESHMGVDDSNTAMVAALAVLILATLSQIPFFRNRAAKITEQWLSTTPSTPSKPPLFQSPSGKRLDTGLWILCALASSPCAYDGVVETFAHFTHLKEQDNLWTPYGTSDTALGIYGVGAAFFLFALGISLIIYYPSPIKMGNKTKNPINT